MNKISIGDRVRVIKWIGPMNSPIGSKFLISKIGEREVYDKNNHYYFFDQIELVKPKKTVKKESKCKMTTSGRHLFGSLVVGVVMYSKCLACGLVDY